MSDTDERGRRLLLSAFKMPSVQTMVSRKSSITNAFVNSIIPVIDPTVEQIAEALSILGMSAENVRCAFCGDEASEWDHLRPLVLKQRPTGFISEIANLVPACGKCNQSKGNKPWKTWIVSSAPRSPTTRGVKDVAERIARISAYERWREPTKINFEEFLGADDWSKYWTLWTELNDEMRICQDFAESLRRRIVERLNRTSA